MVDEASRVRRAVSEVLGLVEKFWECIGIIKPETNSLKIRCPERTAEYRFSFKSIALEHGIKPRIDLEIPTITGIEIMSLSTHKTQSQAVVRTENGFVLLLDELPEDDKGYLATAQFLVQDPESIGLLVDRRSKADRVGMGDIDKYWLHAQMKYPETLQSSYADVEISELDVGVDVGLYEALRIAMPKSIPKTMEALRDLITERNPHEVWRKALQYSRVAKGNEAEYLQRLQEIQALISSDEFHQFVDVTKDFRYFQTLPAVITPDSPGLLGVPKFARVVARTSLSVDKDKLVAKGTLIYKSKDFQKKAEDIFGVSSSDGDEKRKKRRRRKKR